MRSPAGRHALLQHVSPALPGHPTSDCTAGLTLQPLQFRELRHWASVCPECSMAGMELRGALAVCQCVILAGACGAVIGRACRLGIGLTLLFGVARLLQF